MWSNYLYMMQILLTSNNVVSQYYFYGPKGPLHVLWQVSFGFWVTWSISSGQENYKSFFFFLKLQFLNYSYTQKSYLAIWQNCFGHFITQKFVSLKSKQFSQFFLVRGKSERIDKIHFAESSGLRPERQKKKFHCSSLSLGKKKLL